jgi:hypothetical protein
MPSGHTDEKSPYRWLKPKNSADDIDEILYQRPHDLTEQAADE